MWRWVHKGLTASDGERVYLEAVRVGRGLMTSKAALARFFGKASPAELKALSAVARSGRSVSKQTIAVLASHGLLPSSLDEAREDDS